MPLRSTPPRVRPVALYAALALAFTAVGCGDSNDDESGGASSDAPAPAVGASEKDKARAAVEQLYVAMGDGDAEGVCEQLSKPAQKQIAEGGQEARTCAEGFQGFFDQAEDAGGLKLVKQAKVENVRVTGDKAVAKVSFGKGSAGDVPLVKESGEWKLEATGAAGG